MGGFGIFLRRSDSVKALEKRRKAKEIKAGLDKEVERQKK